MSKEITLIEGKIKEQLSELSEEELSGIIFQSNNWNAYSKQMGMMRSIVRDMKLVPELPSDKPTDSNPLLRVEFPAEGGVLTYMENFEHPFRGFPDSEFVEKMDTIKKIIRSGLGGLYNEMKGIRLRLLTLLPAFWVFGKAIRATVYANYRLVDRFKLKPENYCRAVREVSRALSIGGHWENAKDIAFREQARDLFCMFLEFDNAYRYRFQDIMPEFNKKSGLVGELVRLLKLMSSREKEQQVKDTWFLLNLGVRIFLRLDKKMRLLIKDFIGNLNLEKVKLTIEDAEYCFGRKDYTFGMSENPTGQIKALYDLVKLKAKYSEEKMAILEESTKEHDKASKESMVSLDKVYTDKLDDLKKKFLADKDKIYGEYKIGK